MKIIVTGGAGFIGSNFIYYMMEKHSEDQIICLDALTYAGHMSTLEVAMKNPAFRFVKASVTDRVTVYRLFEEEHPDIVVNFAAESHVDRSIENPEELITYVEDRKGHDRRYAIDPSKIHRELGWLPETSFAEGIKKTINWYLNHQEWWRPIVEKEMKIKC